MLVYVPRKIRAFCEHAQPLLPDKAADTRRLVTFFPSRLERLFFAPMNMNYHAEHHLWASVPYHNLPGLHRVVGLNSEIEIRRSYLGFVWEYVRSLPLSVRSGP